ncbi:GNAT family N-acetyltransferase [Actinocatenispora comari]|uniref:N-acetyltransferase domain-containing protein n=1 Tax=Actinocatenispora comari TaxID=2807577 RepID=A0A8J4EHJ3_9ACTN|nr:GNAT family N-acetyltransferase [Actinocatenispora comari]GIL25072.1 hypothetical protein NUM_03270 [Actinocatenispora comari]
MDTTGLTVRAATTADVSSLVELRVANAEAHLALAPDTYRIPERDVVTQHFASMLAGDSGQDAVFVAETAEGHVVGMVEVLRRPEPPDHQILRPVASAEVHTVVLPDARGLGAGSALLAAARRWATDHGIGFLSAGIHHRNAGAVRFYSSNGFAESGLSLVRRLAR